MAALEEIGVEVAEKALEVVIARGAVGEEVASE